MTCPSVAELVGTNPASSDIVCSAVDWFSVNDPLTNALCLILIVQLFTVGTAPQSLITFPVTPSNTARLPLVELHGQVTSPDPPPVALIVFQSAAILMLVPAISFS